MTRRLASYLRRHHLALLALFVALGGTSYAAVKLPRDSVSTAQVKTGAIRSDEVRDRSLTGQDFAPGTLPEPPSPGWEVIAPRTVTATETVTSDWEEARAAAPEITLATRGSLSLVAKCSWVYHVGSHDTTIADLFLKSSRDGALMSLREFGPGTKEADRRVLTVTNSTPGLERAERVAAVGADDSSLMAQVTAGATRTGPSAVFPSQRSCVFTGFVAG